MKLVIALKRRGHKMETVEKNSKIIFLKNNSEINDQISKIQDQVNEKIEKEKTEYNITKLQPDLIASTDILTALNNDEDGDAELFICVNKNKLIYDHNSGYWYVWKNERWQLDKINQNLVSFDGVIDIYFQEIESQNTQQIQAVKDGNSDAEKKTERIKRELLNRIKKLRKVNRKTNILKLASSGENSLGITGEEWDSQHDMLACENGVFNLKTKDFKKHSPEDYIKTIAPVEFLGLDVPAPEFNKFLNTSLNNNKELVDFVQRIFGSAISGSVIEHRIYIFWGENGRNGKGTLLEANKSVLGPLACPIPSELLMKQKNSRSSAGAAPDILNLKGKRIVWASETEEGRHINVSKLKWLSGGDTLTARGIYEKHYTEFVPTHSIFLLTNHKPHIPSNENAMWQRVLLIPFELSFVDNPKKSNERKRDPHLKEKLLKEKSGILAWLINGYFEYQRDGLNPPEIILDQINQYKEDEDSVQTFIKECCSKDENSISNSTDLYNAYKEFCKESDLIIDSHKNFGIKLSEKFLKGNNGKVYYKGISLLI